MILDGNQSFIIHSQNFIIRKLYEHGNNQPLNKK